MSEHSQRCASEGQPCEWAPNAEAFAMKAQLLALVSSLAVVGAVSIAGAQDYAAPPDTSCRRLANVVTFQNGL
jgi:hypothetical protein